MEGDSSKKKGQYSLYPAGKPLLSLLTDRLDLLLLLRFCQVLKGAVGATLCQNKAKDSLWGNASQ